MSQPSAQRIAVLGAGPVGLEAALYARALGLTVTVYERGRVAEHLQRWGHATLFSPFAMNSTALGRAAIRAENPKHELPGDQDCVTGRDHVGAYLEPLAMTGQLIETLKLEARVVQVGRTGLLKGDVTPKRADRPFRLLIRDAKGDERIEEADVVLDCTGTYGQPRWLGEGGIPAVGESAARAQVAGGLEDILGKDRPKYAGKTVLVVGGGYTAATNVCRLSELAAAHSEQWTIWLARGPRSTPLPRHPNDPFRERDRLAGKANMLACRREGNVEFHASSSVESILTHGPDKGFTVTAQIAGKPTTWNVDRVIASVGYSPDTTLYRELQIQDCPTTLGPIGTATALMKHLGLPSEHGTQEHQAAKLRSGTPPLGAATLKTPEPNFYILGAKSYGRNSQFLMRNGFEQVREVFTLVTGNPKLDLYAAGR